MKMATIRAQSRETRDVLHFHIGCWTFDVRCWMFVFILLPVLAALHLCGWGPRTADADGIWPKVIRVDDGDTVQLLDGRRVRYIGIDSPERGEPGKGEFLAEEASRFNRALVLGREVRLELEGEERDRFGRLLAQVYLKDGLWVNQALVREGLAHVLYQAPNVDKFEELLADQRGAMEKRRGIWIKTLQETEATYPGQRKTRKMHRPDCPRGLKISPANRVLFKTKREAYWLGYSPCRQCKP